MKKENAIWMFAGGPMQEIAAREIIGMGFRLIITDRNKQCICMKYADETVELDTFDIKGNLEEAKRLKEKFHIRAAVAIAADCHETAANVCKYLQIHAIDPNISHACRFKNITRRILTEEGLLQPKFECVTNLDAACLFLKRNGGKGVVKATDNSGSRGFRAIHRPEELTEQIFERAIAEGTTGIAIMEEMMCPVDNEIAEQSVETVWYNGEMYWLNWVDRLFRKDFQLFEAIKTGLFDDIAWGVEIGHINPALHNYAIKKEVFDIIYRAGKAIGMDRQMGGHILKADIMLTGKGPCIIELTPRCSGGWDSSGTTPLRGANFIAGIIRLALGAKLDLNLWHTYFEYKNPSLYASILADVDREAIDCIGRRFAVGTGFVREKSLEKAVENLKEERYVV